MNPTKPSPIDPHATLALPSNLARLSPQDLMARLVEAGVLAPKEIVEVETMTDAQALVAVLERRGLLTPLQVHCLSAGKEASLRLGNYILCELLGEGGMGSVYRARHRMMNRQVAVKVMKSELTATPELVDRFLREIHVIGELRHPNLVLAHDAGEADGRLYLVMEFLEGEDLQQLVERDGPLPLDRALDLVVQAARGLEHAHAAAIVHRDVKPGNLWLDRTGTIKVLDLGLASCNSTGVTSRPAAGLTEHGKLMGSPHFMAPEQARDAKSADARADVYALAATFWFLVTGKTLFDGETLYDVIHAHLHMPAPVLRSVRREAPPALEQALSQMLAKRPEDRPASMTAVIQMLGTLRAAWPQTVELPQLWETAFQQLDAPSELIGVTVQEPLAETLRDPHAAASVGRDTSIPLDTQDSALLPPHDREPATVPPPIHPPAPPPAKEIPEQLGRYRMFKKLGQGNMGAVYLAEDTALGRQVAIKISSIAPNHAADPDGERFLREGKILAAMHHPYICPVYDVGEAGGRRFICMAYLEGVTLDAWLQERARAEPREAARIVRQIALSLDFAHRKQIIHRDLKPGNIMLSDGGEPILMDFGLARQDTGLTLARATQPGEAMGTPAYIPPEQAKGDLASIGPHSDVYSLGAILFELLTGQTPFVGGMWQVLYAHVNAPAPRLRSIDPGFDARLEGICERAMAKLPEQRFASALAMAEALAEFLHSTAEPQTAQSPPPVITLPPSGPAASHVRWIAGGVVAATLAVVAVVAILIAQPGADSSSLTTAAATSLPTETPFPTQTPATGSADSTPASDVRPLTTVEPTHAPAAPAEITNSIGMTLVRIAPGTFLMGSPPAEVGHQRDEEQYEVRLTRAFYLGKFEVTQREYEAVTGSNPSRFSASGDHSDQVKGLATERFPVENISYDDLLAFCSVLSQREGKRYRLPTEAEWEYACRAGTTTPFTFGPTASGREANCDGQQPYGSVTPGPYLQRPAVVGSYPANPFGLCDLHGNVQEWCGDWYGPYDIAHPNDPMGPAAGQARVVRGGSWLSTPRSIRSAYRLGQPPEARLDNLGFRVVLEE